MHFMLVQKSLTCGKGAQSLLERLFYDLGVADYRNKHALLN